MTPSASGVTSSETLRRSPAEHLEIVAIEVASIAAVYVRSEHGSAKAAGTKSSPTDVVTETDLASESLIRDQLRARCPGSSIVGEEYGATVGANNVRWIVDPIDGTVNFLYGLPVVSISIAATINDVTVAGAVVDMVNGDAYSATLGGGSRCNQQPLRSSTETDVERSLVGTGFAYEASVRAEQAQTLQRLLPACRDIRCMGSAALNLCWVAAGLLDGYFERNIKLYDYAAGELIAREAGAIVTLPTKSGDGLAFAAAPGIAADLRELIS